ncbi:ATP-binding protein [Chromatocurvus halotolerans]|uniref:histidine kinase n=1 Tax=Chromatocurvus halotolerans TaxID=1132028 RepID=A0A4R2KV47_9GAMM|nr:ATP-binding protein [Chromatocurvus halotolerans]TCO76707.1 two-component system sensor histidine kinase PhoQ [Chromatocurvus halotolerans]
MSRLPQSLAARLLLASALLLPLCLGATSWSLERAHRLAAEAAQAERLQLHLMTLLAQAEFDDALRLPTQVLESRLTQPGSGLVAYVTTADNALLWSSPSALMQEPAEMLASLPALAPGQQHLSRHADHQRLVYPLIWETDAGAEVPLRFVVMESLAPLRADVAAYRRSLLLWLGGTLVLLLATQLLVMAWGLRPLRDLGRDIARIERGERDNLPGEWPREIRPVTDNLKTLLHSEQARRERMRNTLSDLAHSLKTPLAVLRSAEIDERGQAGLVAEQVSRMEEVVEWQLQRAVGNGHRLLSAVDLCQLVERLRGSLLKVYAARELTLENAVPRECRFRGDERDLMEVLGNVLDNACKHAVSRVRLSAGVSTEGLAITIEDDGPGIPDALREHLTERGMRADNRHPGQGLGLAVAADIVDGYGGRLFIQRSDLGGTAVVLLLGPGQG